MKLEFSVIGLPKPQARPKFARRGTAVMTFSPKTDWFQLVYCAALQRRAQRVMQGPLKMSITLVLPYPKSLSAKKRRETKHVSVRPDLDNYAKAILDALNNASVWNDDAQVSDLSIKKIYGDIPCAEIEVEELMPIV